jgi:hypothetical protein
VIPVRGTPVVRAWYVVHRTSQFVAPTVEAFRYFLLERGQSFLQQHFPHVAAICERLGAA